MLIATLITTTSVVAVAGLSLYGIRLQTTARDSTDAQYVAVAQVERLRALPATGPARQVGGSLTTDVADHFDTTNPTLRTRWVVVTGPAGTQDITLTVVSSDPLVPPTQVRVLLW